MATFSIPITTLTQKQNLLLTAEELEKHIRGCILNSRESQKTIYSSFYGYAMAVCDRYTNNQDDAVEILNDGFLKIFKEVHQFSPRYEDVMASFKGWLRKIMIYTAIDHFRKNHKHRMITEFDQVVYNLPSDGENAVDKLSYEEIINAIQNLSPAYRTVFNLFVIEGFHHEEIASQLEISIGTSKSNLSKARIRLQKILQQLNQKTINKDDVRRSG